MTTEEKSEKILTDSIERNGKPYFDAMQYGTALEAMDIHAKEVAIEFAEWVKDNHYTKNLNNDDTRWYKYFSQREDLPNGVCIMSGVSEYFTTEQLYELFLQSKNQKQ